MRPSHDSSHLKTVQTIVNENKKKKIKPNILMISKNMYLQNLRFKALAIIICYLLGCGADDSPITTILPVVTIEVVGQLANEQGFQFRINADPAPESDLAVLVEGLIWDASAEDNQAAYTWIIISKFTSSKEFSLGLDIYVPWQLSILPLNSVNLKEYPIDEFGVAANTTFSKYTVGNPSRVVTEPPLAAKLLDVLPDTIFSIPANVTFYLIFDPLPANITTSHGRIIVDGDLIKIVGPFRIGNLDMDVSWDDGRGSYTIRRTISRPDYEPPRLVRVWAFNKNGFGIGINENVFTPKDTERIELIFSEDIWVDELIHSQLAIQTEQGKSLGWEEEIQFLNDDEIVLVRSGGVPLNPRTNYIIVGTVSDYANETEIWMPLTTD